ncbi:MAG: molecular chaperone DnaK, partial [Bdellovibrionota bacterium]
KNAIQAEDVDKMKAAQDKLTAASHKLAEEMYKASQAASPDASAGQPGGQSAGGEKKDDEPIDAEFTEEK